jgi:predicted ribosomally synthesized peptide with nif11-like leader
MSMQNLEQFYDKVQANGRLEAEATSALQKGPAALVALGAREGFSFSTEELAAGLEKLSGGRELSDTDLDLVAGGTRPNCSESWKINDSSDFSRRG